MGKYKVEGEIDFYEELKKCLQEEQEKDQDQDPINSYCLITNEKLTDKFVKLGCGHCFNYKPLWHEVYNFKFGSSPFKDNRLIKYNCIHCPYCRTQNDSLLPYYPELDLKLAYGITSSDESNKLILVNNELVYKYTVTYSTGICNFLNENDIPCSNTYVLLYSGLGKTYCCKHYNKVKHQHLKDEKIQKKLEEKQEKIQEKQQKLEEKLKKLEERKQKKLLQLHKLLGNEQSNDLGENIIISTNIVINSEKCSYIFKKGANKDKQCICKVFNNNLCKRHFV